MSGHSKWSKVKHQKESTDAIKGKIFTKLANAIAIAVRQGGSHDPGINIRLRFAVDKARAANMPKEKIEHAIARSSGVSEGARVEYIVYEGFGPRGVGLMIESATDNKQRTSQAVKNLLDKGEGAFAGSGAVSHLFVLVGVVTVTKREETFDRLFEKAASCGALDVADRGETMEVFCEPAALHTTKECLQRQGCSVTGIELSYKPKTPIQVDEATKQSIDRLIVALEDLDDVQRVFSTAL